MFKKRCEIGKLSSQRPCSPLQVLTLSVQCVLVSCGLLREECYTVWNHKKLFWKSYLSDLSPPCAAKASIPQFHKFLKCSFYIWKALSRLMPHHPFSHHQLPSRKISFSTGLSSYVSSNYMLVCSRIYFPFCDFSKSSNPHFGDVSSQHVSEF